MQAAHQLRFENLEEFKHVREEIKYYIAEAIKAEKAGKKVEMKKQRNMLFLKS